MRGVCFHYEGGVANGVSESAYPDLWSRLCSYWSPAAFGCRASNGAPATYDSAGALNTRLVTIVAGTSAVLLTPHQIGAAWNFGTLRDRSMDLKRDHRSLGLDGDKSWTMSAWINPSQVASAMGVIKLGNDGGTLTAMSIYIAVAGSGMLSCEWGGANGARTATGVIVANIWQHVAVVKRSGAINTTTELYLNGNPVAISTASTNTPAVAFNGTDYIGRFTTVGDKYGGLMSEIGVWSRAFSRTEVMSLAMGASPLKKNGRRLGLGFVRTSTKRSFVVYQG